MKKRLFILVSLLTILMTSFAQAETEAAASLNGMYGENMKVELTKDVFVPSDDILAYKCKPLRIDISTMEGVYGATSTIDANSNNPVWQLFGGNLKLSSGKLSFLTHDYDKYLTISGYARDANDMIVQSYIVNDSALEELSFKEAHDIILSIYRNIPMPQSFVEVVPNITITPFHTETIQNVFDIMDKGDWWVKPSHRTNTGTLIEYGVEFYFATVEFCINDIPITMYGYSMPNDRYIFGSSMTFIVNKEGLKYMSTPGEIYIPTQVVSTKSRVMTAREALEKTGEFFDRIIMNTPALFTDMYFNYYPIATDNKDGYMLKPVWHMLLSENDDDSGVWLIVDAITGEFLNF